jgi:hypothetical protein
LLIRPWQQVGAEAVDVQERLARLQRRTALAERLQRQAQTGIEEQQVTTTGSPPRTPAAEAVYEILLAIDPVLRRHAGLTVGIWTTPPPGTDEFPDAVAMISVDPVDHTLSLHFPVPPAHSAEVPVPEPPDDIDPVDGADPVGIDDLADSVEPAEVVEVVDLDVPAESPQPQSEPSSDGVSEWADEPDDGDVPELVQRAVEQVVGRAAGRPVEEAPPAPAADDDGDDLALPVDGSSQEAPMDGNGDGLSDRQRLQPLGNVPSRQPERPPEQTPERGSVAHELAALLRYPDVTVP